MSFSVDEKKKKKSQRERETSATNQLNCLPCYDVLDDTHAHSKGFTLSRMENYKVSRTQCQKWNTIRRPVYGLLYDPVIFIEHDGFILYTKRLLLLFSSRSAYERAARVLST